MKFNKVFVRVVAIILAVLLAAAILLSVFGRAADEPDDAMEALRSEELRLAQERREVQADIYELEEKNVSALEMKAAIDANISLAVEEADNLQAQIAEYDRLVFEKEYLLQKSVETAEDRREQYKNSLRAKEERGTASYYEIILGAQDWTDFLSRFDFVRDVMNYDESVYNALVDARTAADKARAALEETEAEKEASGERLAEKQAELNDLVARADGYIAGLEGSLDSYMELTAERDTAENALFTRLEDLAAETERMRSISSTGTVIWPSEDSRYVSNGFGGHTHPVFGVYSVHYGIDIAAAYGTRVMAVDGGIVVEAGYDSACGNYVLITHGSGIHTFYANLSKLSVASGDTVSQGTVIGLVGSTGVSTTPHLFFQTIRGGARVNPLEYYSNYELSPSA